MWKAISVALLAYAVLVLALYTFQRRLLFQPDTSRPSLEMAGLSGVSEVVYETADGLILASWYAPAAKGMPTIVYFHGNAGHIGHRGSKVRPFLERGYGMLLVGYRGYGGNPGAPSEAGLLADGRAAIGYLQGLGVSTGDIVLYGESLGSGVAVRLAMEHRVQAVVLEAPFTSIAEVAQRSYWYVPAFWLVKDRFESGAVIDRIAAPLLVVHGERDRIIPVKHGKALFAAAIEPKTLTLFPRAGHNDLYDHGAFAEIDAFLAARRS